MAGQTSRPQANLFSLPEVFCNIQIVSEEQRRYESPDSSQTPEVVFEEAAVPDVQSSITTTKKSDDTGACSMSYTHQTSSLSLFLSKGLLLLNTSPPTGISHPGSYQPKLVGCSGQAAFHKVGRLCPSVLTTFVLSLLENTFVFYPNPAGTTCHRGRSKGESDAYCNLTDGWFLNPGGLSGADAAVMRRMKSLERKSFEELCAGGWTIWKGPDRG
ncbi:hypothetical protein WMY93_031697 [Mugilogobius chulae]|uniref:Uncharacterized protein n=1 Tax=Mugilogobius chulae TaxID=88201 RepID=A0AAW0MHQ6_9GOBI